jgi:regulator of sigma E protease
MGTYLIRRSFGQAIVEGPSLAVTATGRMLGQIRSLFSDVSNLHQLSGPVAIIQASGVAAKAGVDRLLEIAVQLSLALMVFNLLPIPILDGGMIVLSLVEAVRAGRREARACFLNRLAVMGALLVFVVVKDFWQILQRWIAMGRIDAP